MAIFMSCKTNDKELKENSLDLSEGEIKKLETIAPATPISTYKKSVSVQSDSIIPMEERLLEKAGPNNRIVLVRPDNSKEKEVQTEIALIEENRITFSNQWILSYWLPNYHELNLRPNQNVNLRYVDRFISGADFKSIHIEEDKRSVLSLVSLGSDEPIRYQLGDNFYISQTEKEEEFVDNESEKVNEVQVLLNNQLSIVKGKINELFLGEEVFHLSLHRSIHYYPKGNDSFESPAYILEFNLTKVE